MAKYVYPAIFEPEDGMYNVSFPDLPGCYTCGDDLTDAMAMAADVLSGWLSRSEEKGDNIPAASQASALSSKPDCIVSLVLCDTTE